MPFRFFGENMRTNVTFSMGNIALIDKADTILDGYFKKVFKGLSGRAQDFIPCVKLLIANRIGDCHSIYHLNELPDEYFKWLGFD